MADSARNADTIPEVDEPPTPEEAQEQPGDDDFESGPSVLSNLLRRSPPQSGVIVDTPQSTNTRAEPVKTKSTDSKRNDVESEDTSTATERTPLIPRDPDSAEAGKPTDIESQESRPKRWARRVMERGQKLEASVGHAFAVAINPTRWDRKAIWQQTVVEPTSCLPAVAVGLLLNILDALSYGKS